MKKNIPTNLNTINNRIKIVVTLIVRGITRNSYTTDRGDNLFAEDK